MTLNPKNGQMTRSFPNTVINKGQINANFAI
jgi:hypothetical protein